MSPDNEPQLRLLSDLESLDRPKPRSAAIGSLLVHAGLIAVALLLPWGSPYVPRDASTVIVPRMRVTPLLEIPRELTQRDPNKGKVAQEVNLAALLTRPTPPDPVRAKPGVTNPTSQPKAFQAPPAPAPTPAPAPRAPMEAPKVESRGVDVTELQARNLPGLGTPQANPPPVQPPPQIQTEEKPKLAFEKPGGNTPRPNTGVAPGRLPMPAKSSVDEAVRQVARSGGGALIVGDLGEGIGGLGEALRNPAGPVKNSSALELLSDPEGVDFKPYLIRILSTVRRNWTAVIPESARLGRRGKVLIQFAIDNDGSVPKLVIATGSGADSLDRAAVAGISASNPFPPLPDEFRGKQIRLQFTFLYNVPK